MWLLFFVFAKLYDMWLFIDLKCTCFLHKYYWTLHIFSMDPFQAKCEVVFIKFILAEFEYRATDL